MRIRQILSRYVGVVQRILLPMVEETIGHLTESQRDLIRILELLELERQVGVRMRGRGRPPRSRVVIARAFVAKAFYNLPTTNALIERLRSDSTLAQVCGFQKGIPSKPTFSRAFAEFAELGFAERVQEALLGKYQKGRVVGHISRDATEIEAREKPAPKVKPAPPPKCTRKAGRPRRGEKVEQPLTRLDLQRRRGLEENLKDLPRACDVATKRNSKGHMESWTGYKLHLDVADAQVPISAILTSASVHDSQAAIPLAQMSAQRVVSCYDLMDAAYDAGAIREHSASLGHVPIIEFNRRKGAEPRVFSPCEAQRFKERTTVERVNGRLKDEFGGRMIRVRGHKKVMTHLMFGLLALTADQLLRLVS